MSRGGTGSRAPQTRDEGHTGVLAPHAFTRTRSRPRAGDRDVVDLRPRLDGVRDADGRQAIADRSVLTCGGLRALGDGERSVEPARGEAADQGAVALGRLALAALGADESRRPPSETGPPPARAGGRAQGTDANPKRHDAACRRAAVNPAALSDRDGGHRDRSVRRASRPWLGPARTAAC